MNLTGLPQEEMKEELETGKKEEGTIGEIEMEEMTAMIGIEGMKETEIAEGIQGEMTGEMIGATEI